MELRWIHGSLGLVGQQVNDVAEQALQSLRPVDRTFTPTCLPFHVTLVHKAELGALQKDQLSKLEADTRHVYSAGVAKKAGVFFVVIIWAAGQRLRKQLGLPPKQFHITLCTPDAHGDVVDKGIDSLLPGQFPAHPSSDFLDHLAFTLHLSGDYERARPFCIELVRVLPASHRGFVRLGDAALWSGQHKLGMLSYACAFQRTAEYKVQEYCGRKMVECSKNTEWGAVFLEWEMSQLPDEILEMLLTPWSRELRSHLSDIETVPTLCLETREKLSIPSPTVTNPFYKLPRFFRWLVPFHLAIMSTPRNEDDIEALISPHLGIRHILTLTEETPLSDAWFSGKSITNTYLPIPNFRPPSVEQMDIVMRMLEDEEKLPLLVHCGGGKGRAGTVAACYLAAYGFGKGQSDQTHPAMTAADAIATLRSLRPGSLETAQQEAFVSKWCSTIWKRSRVLPDLPSEAPPCALEIEGELASTSDLFLLVGLPGAGKSWFSKALLARSPKGWTHVSQDNSGSRSHCETEISRAHGRVLLDRCNTSDSDRKLWLELASIWATAPVCIWFDYDRHLCTSRAQSRAGHPTLPPGSRVRNAVEQMQKAFVRPTLKEGFKAIVIVRSFAASQDLVHKLSPPVALFKFPRTPHLIDLGAVTFDDVVANTSIQAQGHVVITEKVDGANMGFSLSADRSQIIVQNRSHYVNPSTHEQFKKLGLWVDQHRNDLYKVLDRDEYFAERYVLFGEWLFATHSISYTRLPDRFMAFDLYDRSSGAWVDRRSLSGLLAPTIIQLVPVLHEGRMPSDAELTSMVQWQSKFYDGPVEGVYVKVEASGIVVTRGKVVRGDFISGNEHWSRGGLRMNGLQSDHMSALKGDSQLYGVHQKASV